MLLTDLLECKKILNIPLTDTSQDYALNYYIQVATDMIEQFLDRPLTKKSRTEYYNGTGTNYLTLKSRPVFISPEPQVWVDSQGLWGQSENSFASGDELNYGGDFGLWLDTDNSSGTMDRSSNGILVRKNNFWEKPFVREQGFLTPYVPRTALGNIKVTYTAGFAPEDLPSQIRMAAIMVVGRLRYMMPIAVPIASESYEERSISLAMGERNYLLGQVKHLLTGYRNWKF